MTTVTRRQRILTISCGRGLAVNDRLGVVKGRVLTSARVDTQSILSIVLSARLVGETGEVQDGYPIEHPNRHQGERSVVIMGWDIDSRTASLTAPLRPALRWEVGTATLKGAESADTASQLRARD
jgi:hypothetical protein